MIDYLASPTRVATGASYGAIAHDEHARTAVQAALANMQECTVGSVLLFLSSAYAHMPQNAIKEAARAAGTPQIFGCCALNLLTEQEWLMDVEGAVAMVFPQELSLQPLTVMRQLGVTPEMVLTLSSPNAATIAINSAKQAQLGAITSDEYGHGPYSVWQSGRIVENEFSLCAFPSSLNAHWIAADGIKRLSDTMQINLVDGHELIQVGEQPPLEGLPEHIKRLALSKPYHLLCAVSENNDINSLEQGHFKLQHLVSADENSGQMRLSGKPKAGRHLFWAIRDAQAAQESIREQLTALKESLDEPPLFGLMFPNIGRGPEFFNGRDADFDCFKLMFPNVPLLGFYGNGEITPGHRNQGLIRRHSTVVALYSSAQASKPDNE